MAHNMKVMPEDDYLHVVVTGDNTPEDVAAYLEEIRGICAEHGLSKVFVEENLAGPPFSIGDVYDVVTAASPGVAPAIRSIAFVDTNPEHDFAAMEFAETVAGNRGVNVRVFRKAPAAREWIRRQ